MSDRARGAVPAVGKALELSLLVALAAVLATTLFGSVVPDYRTAAGAELGDRTLARGATSVEDAVPAAPGAYARLNRTVRVELPGRIRGERYEVRAADGRLRLVHPNGRVGGSVRPVLPADARLDGGWASERPARVEVRVRAGGPVRVRLVEGEP